MQHYAYFVLMKILPKHFIVWVTTIKKNIINYS